MYLVCLAAHVQKQWSLPVHSPLLCMHKPLSRFATSRRLVRGVKDAHQAYSQGSLVLKNNHCAKVLIHTAHDHLNDVRHLNSDEQAFDTANV